MDKQTYKELKKIKNKLGVKIANNELQYDVDKINFKKAIGDLKHSYFKLLMGLLAVGFIACFALALAIICLCFI